MMKTMIFAVGLASAMFGVASAQAPSAPDAPTPAPAPASAATLTMAKADTPPAPTAAAPKPVCRTVAIEGSMTRRTICN